MKTVNLFPFVQIIEHSQLLLIRKAVPSCYLLNFLHATANCLLFLPVMSVRSKVWYLQHLSIRFILHLMKTHPLFFITQYTNLYMEEARRNTKKTI